ncbi:MAG: hypothetical protein Q9187_004341 [Circinaria calcarea]
MKLVDKMRLDPFAPDNRTRAIMVSAFYPVKETSACYPTRIVSYVPPATAAFMDSAYGLPNGTFESLGIHACRLGAPVSKNSPLVIFSPGLGGSRLTYQAIAQQVASTGYIVVLLDHPYDTNIIEFPDGSVVLGILSDTEAEIESTLKARTLDASFTIDQLSRTSVARSLVPGSNRGLDVRRVGMFGHSLGGATAASTVLNDTRVAGGLNMDGSFWGPVVNQGLTRPFLLFGRQSNTRFENDSWATIWPRLLGWKLELTLAGSRHNTFTDGPLLVKISGLADLLPPGDTLLLGTIDGARALDVITSYVTAFMDFVLRGFEAECLRNPCSEYPEISFVD